jgi:hypothetical protein
MELKKSHINKYIIKIVMNAKKEEARMSESEVDRLPEFFLGKAIMSKQLSEVK